VRFVIYCHTCIPSGKKYVGQTKLTLEARWRQHVSGHSKCRVFCAAIRKYGPDVFDHEVLEECTTQESANAAEAKWIAALNTVAPNGYNLDGGGGVAPRHAETCRRLREMWSPSKREQHSAIIRAVRAAQLPATRKEISRKAHDAQSPAQRSARGRKAAASMTAAQKSARGRMAVVVDTPMLRQRRGATRRETWAALTPVQRSAIVRKGWVTLSTAQRAARMRKVMPPERRSAAAYKREARKRFRRLVALLHAVPVAASAALGYGC
jgi:group I intron endonuclease